MSKTNQNNWAEALAETLSMAAQDIHDIVHLTTDQLTQKTGMSADQILDLRMAIAKASGLEILDCPCCDAVLDFTTVTMRSRHPEPSSAPSAAHCWAKTHSSPTRTEFSITSGGIS